jgi:cation diffusion facilitator CzcD-associated flavoprotein CzcO
MPRTDGDSQHTAAIAIIGAGAAGLSAAAALKTRGCEAIVFDKDERIGGTWSRRYERLSLHTVRRFSGLAHYGVPRAYPKYIPKDLFAQYLQEYAARFRLDVRLGQRVRKVRSRRGSLLWEVETDGGIWRVSVVIVATGHYNERVLPRWLGIGDFGGRLLHSADYDSGARFAGERALVIGIGNSGAEIAADLVEQGASYVAISVRTPPPIMPRDLFGLVPVQLLGIALTPVPAPRLLDRAGAVVRRIGVGDLRPYGLGEAAWGPFTARRPAVIDVGFLENLKGRRIQVRPNVSRFTPNGVAFADGSDDDFDVVIAATGFDTGLKQLLDVPGAVGEDGQPRFRSGRPTAFEGLYFTGFDETVRGHLFEAKRESKRVARIVSDYLEQSSDLATQTRAGRSTA